MDKEKNKRFFLNIVEYAVMNPDYYGYRVARIEVQDELEKSGYAIGEGSFTLPEDIGYEFREIFDFIDMDTMCRITLDTFDDDRIPEKYILKVGNEFPSEPGYVGGNISVYKPDGIVVPTDNNKYTLPKDLAEKFIKLFDNAVFEKPCRINFDMFDYAKQADKRREERGF